MIGYENLLENSEIRLSSGKLNIEGKDYTLVTFRQSFFELIDKKSNSFLELLLLEREDKQAFNKLTKDLFEGIKKDLTPKMRTDLGLEQELENLTPVVNMEEDEILLIDEANSIVSDIKYSSWLKAIDADYRKSVVNNSMPIAKFIFDPYTDMRVRRGSVDSGTRDMVFINTYSAPEWRRGAEAVEKCPEFLSVFMGHLFMDNQEQIDYCLRWMAEAMLGRNETYLVLNGDKGVGKNTLYEIMKAVVSPKYAVTAPQSLTTSHFNSVLNNKRLILLDEYKINRTNHLFLKKIINKYQTIERKGVDADREFETFNSFMIFHNDISDMYLEKDDRRFSALDITTKNLLELWSADEIEDYMRELNNPHSELTKEIGSYLLWVGTKEFKNATPFKGKKFHDIVEFNMPTWLQIVVAMIENGEVKKGRISFKKEIEKKLSSEMMGNKKVQWRKSTLEKYLKEYRYKDRYCIGTIEGGTKAGLELLVNPDLLELFNYEVEDEDIFGFDDSIEGL